MTERPILFSGPMVRALLAGTKTQTRRKMRIQPKPFAGTVQVSDGVAYWDGGANDCGLACPYGSPGDRLWVRETWQRGKDFDALEGMGCSRVARDDTVYYRADQDADPFGFSARPWRPGIHMPRVACRLLLNVTNIRAERLQFISEQDAEAEGADKMAARTPDARDAYRYIWEGINGPGSWAENPWVWVVEFKRAE